MTLQDARWIPIGSLPVDLQLEVLRTSGPIASKDRRPESKTNAFLVGLGLLSFALLHLFTVNDAPGFHSLTRLGLLLVGGWLVLRHALATLRPGFRAHLGRQMIFGEGSLVVADERCVRVLPAEALEFKGEAIKLGKETVGRIRGNDAAQLRELIEKAKADPSVREANRYRRAAAGARPVPSLAIWSAGTTTLASAALLLSTVLLIETGPLDAHWSQVHDGEEKTAAVVKAASGVDDARDHLIASARRALARHKHDNLLAAARGDGGEDAVRAFLDAYDADEARPGVQERLDALCAARIVDQPGDTALTHTLHAVQRTRCGTARKVVYFRVVGNDTGTYDAQTLMDDLCQRAGAMAGDARYEAIRLFTTSDRSGEPYVELTLGRWQIEVRFMSSSGKPVPGAGYVHRGPLVPGRWP